MKTFSFSRIILKINNYIEIEGKTNSWSPFDLFRKHYLEANNQHYKTPNFNSFLLTIRFKNVYILLKTHKTKWINVSRTKIFQHLFIVRPTNLLSIDGYSLGISATNYGISIYQRKSRLIRFTQVFFVGLKQPQSSYKCMYLRDRILLLL